MATEYATRESSSPSSPIDHLKQRDFCNRRRILVIDDDPGLLDMLQDTLPTAGFEVAVAESGAEGVKSYWSERFDLVILDIFMPTKDGFETLMEIRRGAPRAKVLAISGGGGRGLKQVLTWAQALGANGVLAKPFTPGELLGMVFQLLDKKATM